MISGKFKEYYRAFPFIQIFAYIIGFTVSLGIVFRSPQVHWYIVIALFSPLFYHYKTNKKYLLTIGIYSIILLPGSIAILFFNYLNGTVGTLNYNNYRAGLITVFVLLIFGLLYKKSALIYRFKSGIIAGYWFNFVYMVFQICHIDKHFFLIEPKVTVSPTGVFRATMTYPEPSAASVYVLFIFLLNNLFGKKNIYINITLLISSVLISSKIGILIFTFAFFQLILFPFFRRKLSPVLNILIFPIIIFVSSIMVYNVKDKIAGISGIFYLFNVISSNENVWNSGANSLVFRTIGPYVGFKGLSSYPLGASVFNKSFHFLQAFKDIEFVSDEISERLDAGEGSYKNYFLNMYYDYGPFFLILLLALLFRIDPQKKKFQFFFYFLAAALCIELFNYLIWAGAFVVISSCKEINSSNTFDLNTGALTCNREKIN